MKTARLALTLAAIAWTCAGVGWAMNGTTHATIEHPNGQVNSAAYLVAGSGALFGIIAWGATTLMMRRPRRPCPRCGARVTVGVLDCSSCGFDFRTVG